MARIPPCLVGLVVCLINLPFVGLSPLRAKVGPSFLLFSLFSQRSQLFPTRWVLGNSLLHWLERILSSGFISATLTVVQLPAPFRPSTSGGCGSLPWMMSDTKTYHLLKNKLETCVSYNLQHWLGPREKFIAQPKGGNPYGMWSRQKQENARKTNSCYRHHRSLWERKRVCDKDEIFTPFTEKKKGGPLEETLPLRNSVTTKA